MKYNTSISANGNPASIFGDGDGTVGLRSLKGCLRWKDAQSQKFNYEQFSGINHSKMVSDQKILGYLESILNNDSENSSANFLRKNCIFSLVFISLFTQSFLKYILL